MFRIFIDEIIIAMEGLLGPRLAFFFYFTQDECYADVFYLCTLWIIIIFREMRKRGKKEYFDNPGLAPLVKGCGFFVAQQ